MVLLDLQGIEPSRSDDARDGDISFISFDVSFNVSFAAARDAG